MKAMKNNIPTDSGHAAGAYWAEAGSEAALAFERLSDSHLRDVARNVSLELASDTTSVCYFVLDGWLVVSKSTEDGQRQIVDFVLPGEVFNPGSAERDQSSTDLAALTRARISVIPQNSWQQLLQRFPEIQKISNRRTAASYSRIAERLLRIGQSHAEARLAYAICELCLRSTELGLVDGNRFHLPLTQQVLGDFVGLSSVHVSRTLRRLRRQGVLETGEQMDIVIRDVDRLAEFAEADLDDLRAQIIPGG